MSSAPVPDPHPGTALALSPPTAGRSRVSPPVADQDANQLFKMYIDARKKTSPSSGYLLRASRMNRFGNEGRRTWSATAKATTSPIQLIDRASIFLPSAEPFGPILAVIGGVARRQGGEIIPDLGRFSSIAKIRNRQNYTLFSQLLLKCTSDFLAEQHFTNI
ncbi:hypothetical protein [Ensifer sp.]|uniref:hypothetical protein n=1 Tax=Ensifer sp. TaxID=1872086 RepID=UPI002E121462|nr:hypothetical protein [Ensifer sp.]